MTQLFLPAVCGAQLVIGLPGRQDPAYFAKVIADNGITIVGFAPSVLREFLKEQGRFPNCLRHVFGSSEAIPLELQHLCLDTIDAELHKFYGLTEAPGVAYGHCRREDDYPYTTIGRPTDMRAYVLDSKLEVVPIGVLGQIYTGGVGLARGYLNRSDTTAERFIPDPFSSEPGARMYKTGDIARWSLDGNIEFHGRKDHQVNIRGFRIELGETEMALSLHTGVQRAAVIAREEKVGQIRLIAYFVANPGATVTGSELRDFLKDKLADNKIPSLYVRLDTMPLLSNGKVNRLALSAIGESGRDLEPEFMAPRTPIEQALAGIWADMLRVEQVGAHDNFFVLGGHSLLAVQMTFRVRDALQVEFPLRSLFESPTLAGMAENIERIRSIYAEQPPLVKG